MRLTEEEAIEKLSQRTYNNTRERQQDSKQRRNEVVDLYGVEYTRQGDNGTPAKFYISISPDMVYLERFEFKLIISPFLSTVGSGTSSATIDISGETSETELGIVNNDVSPKKHKHTFSGTNTHTHTLTAGVTPVTVSANTFSISIEGIDITSYLSAQTTWVNGEGIFPSTDIEDNYDILAVASLLMAENRKADADKLLSSGYKEIAISANGPFQVTLVNYLKLSHTNR